MNDTDAELEQKHGLELQTAILHILDGRRHNIVLSEETLDLEEPQLEKYVRRYVNRCRNDMRTKPGTFHADSVFQKDLQRYFRDELSLAQFSAQACSKLIKWFEQEEARSFECLFVDYREDDVPWLAVILLEEQDMMTCFTSAETGRLSNTIRFGTSALPAFSKPVSSFAAVNMITWEIRFVDEGKWKDGHTLLKTDVLEAEDGISRKEVIQAVKEIACEAAEECEENATAVLSQVKNYISDTVKEGLPLNTETLVSEVFEEKPVMAEVFRRKAEEKTLPREVELPRAVISASMRKQKITTDTGIEISFPAEYFQNSDYIEFRTGSDGNTTIEIKRVGKITNRL